MNREQALATLTLMGYEPAFVDGSPAMYHVGENRILTMGNQGLNGVRMVICATRFPHRAIIPLPEPRSITDLELVWMAEAAMNELKPGHHLVCQQIIRGMP